MARQYEGGRLYDTLDALDRDASNDQMVMAHALALRNIANAIREQVESVAAGYLNSHQACAKIADMLGVTEAGGG